MFERMACRSGQALWTIIFFSVFLLPFKTWGSTKALDMNVTEDEGHYRSAIYFSQRPSFKIHSKRWKGLAFSFFQTEPTPGFSKSVEEMGGDITLNWDENSGDLFCDILLERPFHAVDVVWLPGKKILLFEVSLSSENTERPQKPPDLRLSNIRLGTHEKGDRMAMKLSQRPPWTAVFQDERHVTLELEARASNPIRRQYGPTQRFGKVVLKRHENPLEVALTLIPSWSNARLFWFEKGDRLVLDILDPGELPIDQALLIPFKPRSHAKQPTAEANGTDQGKAINSERPPYGKDRPEKTSLGLLGPAPPVQEELDAPQELVAFVRRKIGPKDKVGSMANKEVTPPPDTYFGNPTNEPSLENIIPDTNRIREWSRHLSSGEAFLFGRILEAWEMKDYRKGADLIHTFMEQYPQSPLGKPMAFLRGDFLLHLLKSGRHDLLPLVNQSYQDAVNRYGDAKEAPWALIRIAQANSYVGNDYAAISYLNTASARYKEGEHLPLLYMTKGKVYLRLKQLDRAIESFKIMTTRFPDSPLMNEARYWIATYYHNKGVFRATEEQLAVIDSSNPNFFLSSPGYLFLRGLNYFYLEDFNRARQYFLRGLNMGGQPETGDLLLSRIGDTYHHQKNQETAKRYYKAAVDCYPEGEGASIARLRLAQYEDEVKALEEVRQKNANKPIGDLALLEVANAYYKKGHYDKAMETSKVLMNKPSHLDISRQATQLYYQSCEMVIRQHSSHENHEKIIDFYQSNLKAHKEKLNPEVLYLVGQAFFKMGLHSDAIPLFESIKPYDLKEADRADYLTAWAKSYLNDGDRAQAIRLLESSRKEHITKPGRQQVSLMLASLYEQIGDKDAAYELLQSVLSEKRHLPVVDMVKAYLSMGRLLNELRLYEKARESLMSGIALAEKDRDSAIWLASAHMLVGDSYHYEGRSRETIKAYEVGFNHGYSSEDKGYWKRRYRLALAHLKEGDTQEAERVFTEIMEEGDPDLEQRVQIKLGMIGLDKQLKRLPL
jgi:tetratricopeptide (TPR) repeat protein